MTCAACQNDIGQASKCVIEALDTIKQHFLSMQNLCVENAKTISQLKQHNEKLYSAIDLLKQRTESRPKPSPKRRRHSPKNPLQELRQDSTEQQLDNNVSSLPESQDSLNMNIALQSDDDEEETITETEPANSPYKPWNTRRKLNIPNCENKQPKGTLKSYNDNSWLGKIPMDKFPLGTTKMSLTLRSKSPRLKQTRLHFDAGKSNKMDGHKEVIESSPNLYTSLKQAKSRSLLQRTDNSSVSDVKNMENSAAAGISRNQPSFLMDDDEIFFDLCPDPITSNPPNHSALPNFSGCSNTSSVMLLTPATQDIVFIDDSIDECNNLNTMDFMAEVVKNNDAASLKKLQEFEAKIIEDRQKAVTKKNPAIISAAAPMCIKPEPLTEPASEFGNESTKLPEDFNMEEDGQEEEEDYIIPRPLMVKPEPDINIRERYNINCDQCEKYIKLMDTHLNDEKIRQYLNNCNHYDERELENKTPEDFWNPHMVSFAADDERNKVLVDRRFVSQKQKEL